MAEIATIARPYAEAAFRVASGEKALGKWLEALQLLGGLVEDERMRALLSDPKRDRADKQKALATLMKGHSGETVQRLVDLLIENGRIVIAPELARQFEALKLEAESSVEAFVSSAFPLAKKEVEDLQAMLEGRYKRKVHVTPTVDPALIGGVRIAVGDEVIDASVHGQLAAMALTLQR